jgi:hypothetical protein
VPGQRPNEAILIPTHIHPLRTEDPMACKAGSRMRAAWLNAGRTNFQVLAEERYR